MHIIRNQNHFRQKSKHYFVLQQTKGSADILYRMMRSYSTKRMTRIWPLALFYNIIDVSAINAFIVWKEINCANATSALGKEECF